MSKKQFMNHIICAKQLDFARIIAQFDEKCVPKSHFFMNKELNEPLIWAHKEARNYETSLQFQFSTTVRAEPISYLNFSLRSEPSLNGLRNFCLRDEPVPNFGQKGSDRGPTTSRA